MCTREILLLQRLPHNRTYLRAYVPVLVMSINMCSEGLRGVCASRCCTAVASRSRSTAWHLSGMHPRKTVTANLPHLAIHSLRDVPLGETEKFTTEGADDFRGEGVDQFGSTRKLDGDRDISLLHRTVFLCHECMSHAQRTISLVNFFSDGSLPFIRSFCFNMRNYRGF